MAREKKIFMEKEIKSKKYSIYFNEKIFLIREYLKDGKQIKKKIEKIDEIIKFIKEKWQKTNRYFYQKEVSGQF